MCARPSRRWAGTPTSAFLCPTKWPRTRASPASAAPSYRPPGRAPFEAYAAEHAAEGEQLRLAFAEQLPAGWAGTLPSFAAGTDMATRDASGKLIDHLRAQMPWLLGGSARPGRLDRRPW